MGKLSPQVDAYITKSPAFAQPMLKRIRRLMHKACPKIEETIKWGVPHFEYKGVVAGMAAFKKHMRFGFWKWGMMRDSFGAMGTHHALSMGESKLTSLSELPGDTILLECIRRAVELNEHNLKPLKPKRRRPEVEPPAEFLAALRRNKKALATFQAFSPSHRREYVEWITGAKRDETRDRRVKTAVQWLSEGKTHNWRYERT